MMTSSLSARASLTLLPIVLTAALHAQDEQWRARNDRGNRYEGAKSVKVQAAPVVTIVGFHAYRANFKPTDPVTLSVAVFVDGDASQAMLTAREINRREFYRMEAKPRPWTRGWNSFGPWPIRDVLRPLRIDATNLAVLFQLDDRRIEPVVIRTNNEAVAINEYQAYFITGKRLDKVEYRLTNASGAVIKKGVLGAKPALIPFTIKLPVAGVPAGWMRLELMCDISGGTACPTFDFHHHPKSPGV